MQSHGRLELQHMKFGGGAKFSPHHREFYSATEQLGWYFRSPCRIKTNNLKRLHILLFHLYNILEMTEL